MSGSASKPSTIVVPDPVALTQALIRCESITPAEAGALTLLQETLKAAGFKCQRMIFTEPGTAGVDNLYARFGSEGPNLCFAGHTDVVPPGDEAAWTVPPGTTSNVTCGHVILGGLTDRPAPAPSGRPPCSFRRAGPVARPCCWPAQPAPATGGL